MQFGYIREWEYEDNETMRQRMLEAIGEDRFLFCDNGGDGLERQNYLFLRHMLRAGDVLFLDELASLGNTWEAIAEEWQSLTGALQVDIVVLDTVLPLDSRLYRAMGEDGHKLEEQLLKMLQYVGGFEQRIQKKHMSMRLQEGKRSGRPPLEMDWELFHATAKRWVAGEIDVQEACEITGSARSSWYKYTREQGYIRQHRSMAKKNP